MNEESISRKPDGNNVYGIVCAPGGLKAILSIAQSLVGNDLASIYVSGYDGAATLRFSSDECDFESTPLGQNDEHLLNGGVAGCSDNVVEFVRVLSERLTQAAIANRFEVYDDDGVLLKVIG